MNEERIQKLEARLPKPLGSKPNQHCKDFEEFISKEPSQEVVRATPEPEYQPVNAIVAFIDVLGTRALMKRITPENAVETTKTLLGIRKVFKEKFSSFQDDVSESSLMIISDSFVLSARKEDETFSKVVEFLAHCQYYCLVEHGIVIRGAISTGEIIGGKIEKDVIIGPAFIDAHELEMENAIFPRIVIDPRIEADKEESYRRVAKKIAVDKDGIRYIDFTAVENVNMALIKERAEKSRKGLNPDTKLGILQKWDWLLTFLDQKERGCLNCCKPEPTLNPQKKESQ